MRVKKIPRKRITVGIYGQALSVHKSVRNRRKKTKRFTK